MTFSVKKYFRLETHGMGEITDQQLSGLGGDGDFNLDRR